MLALLITVGCVGYLACGYVSALFLVAKYPYHYMRDKYSVRPAVELRPNGGWLLTIPIWPVIIVPLLLALSVSRPVMWAGRKIHLFTTAQVRRINPELEEEWYSP